MTNLKRSFLEHIDVADPNGNAVPGTGLWESVPYSPFSGITDFIWMPNRDAFPASGSAVWHSTDRTPVGLKAIRDEGTTAVPAEFKLALKLETASSVEDGTAVSLQTATSAASLQPLAVSVDPLYADQWHFDLMGNGGGRAYIERVWQEFTGAGIKVGVYDSGVQSAHHDLDGNYDSSLHVVIDGVTMSGEPGPSMWAHGTAVAGIIAAERNGEGGVGVAYGASITGVNILEFGSPISVSSSRPGFLESLRQMTNFDVTNHSWGFTLPYDFYFRTDIIVAAMQYAVDNGRGGLGVNIVKSSGNANIDSNGDGLNGTRYTITVNALLENGFVSSYSNFGAATLVSAAGGDWEEPAIDGTRKITTTDLLGTAGFNTSSDPSGAQDFTDQMNGTSAAAPMVTGVIALMLDSNPDLGWRDVQNILALSAFQTGSGVGGGMGLNEDHEWLVNGAGNWNGGGMHFSEDYGFGNVDPFGAVRMAEAFAIMKLTPKASANEVVTTSGQITIGLNPHNFAAEAPMTVQFNIADNLSIENVQLNVNYTSVYFSTLNIFLVSPEGTEIQVQTSVEEQSGDFFKQIWSYGVTGLRGELSAGLWTLRFTNESGGTLVNSLEVMIYGQAPEANDVYHYTDEYSTFALMDPARNTINDSDGGKDWINASAMTSDVYINLANRAVSLVTIGVGANIENAISGDGNDTLFGNGQANQLFGMRGNDLLRGGRGADLLDGGTGQDTADYSTSPGGVTVSLVNGVRGAGSDATGDRLRNIEHLAGSQHDDVLTGNNGSNDLAGGDGNDTLTGGRGADNLTGGNGNDTLTGGIGTDTLAGGSGNDAFRYDALNEIGDTILDFSSNAPDNNDRFEFEGIVFGGLTDGTLITGQFKSSNAAVAKTPDVRFFFELDRFILRYDPDGNGAEAAVVIAKLQPGATMSIDDILIV